MQVETKVNDKRASRTRKIPEVDVVAKAEDNIVLIDIARLIHSGGVCVVDMHENVQSRNLGDPVHSLIGNYYRSRMQDNSDGEWEVRWAHSTEEAE